MRTLESWIGTELFHRDGGRLRLTEKGADYHQRISRALGDIVAATSDIMGDSAENILNVWCIPGFAAEWLGEQVAEFEVRWPIHRVELRPSDTMADLANHEADVDIRYYGDTWGPRPGGRGLRYVELARRSTWVVASPALVERIGPTEDVQQLLTLPLLHEEHEEQWRAWFRFQGLQVDRLGGPLLWHAHMAVAAARLGRGIALASSSLAWRDLANGSLVRLDIPNARLATLGGYYFVSRESRWSSQGITRLRNFLLSNVDKPPQEIMSHPIHH